MSRCALIRPAIRKLAPSANFSRACAISPEVWNAAPKGATPSFSKAANFSRRNASNSLSVCSMPGSDSKQNRDDEQIEAQENASIGIFRQLSYLRPCLLHRISGKNVRVYLLTFV